MPLSVILGYGIQASLDFRTLKKMETGMHRGHRTLQIKKRVSKKKFLKLFKLMTGFMNLVADQSLLAFELDTNLVGSELQSFSLDSQALRAY